jgi:hypothetical protein
MPRSELRLTQLSQQTPQVSGGKRTRKTSSTNHSEQRGGVTLMQQTTLTARPFSEVLFKEFLEMSNVYGNAPDNDHNIIRVIRNLIPTEIRNQKINRAILSTSNKNGVLGLLFPSSELEVQVSTKGNPLFYLV